MKNTYSKEQLEKLFDQLPEELQETIFSFETSKNILEACEKYEIASEKIKKVSELVGQVLFGLLKPIDFNKFLEKEINISSSVAKGLAQEINRFIFYPVKPLLDNLYKLETDKKEVENKSIKEREEKKEIKLEKKEEIEERSTKPSANDTYREIIE